MTPPPPLDAWLDEFDRNWAPDQIAARVAATPAGIDRREALIELVKIDLERCWQAGFRPRLEEYLDRFPELGAADDLPDELIRVEIAARERCGDSVSESELRRRFPRQAEHLTERASAPTGSTTAPSGPFTPRDRESPVVPERYRIVRRLGGGAMGDVYLAWDTALSREVALKVPRFAGGRERALRARFRREAAAAARLRHPNLAQVYDVGQADGVDYLTMSYIEGSTLGDRIRAGPVAVPDAVRWVVGLAGGLAEAHRQGVVHRDLKPANVILTPAGEPVVVDFGLALFEEPGGPRLTRDGSVLGTPCYMAPEQVRGDRGSIGPAADVYALGVILYELLTGTVPFTGGIAAIFDRIVSAPPPPPSARRPEVSPDLDAVCLRALAKIPEERFSSMVDFAAAVRAASSTPERNPPAPPTSATIPDAVAHFAPPEPTAGFSHPPEVKPAPETPERQLVRRRWLGVAAGGAVAATAGIASYVRWGRTPTQPSESPTPNPSPPELKPAWTSAGRIDVGGAVTCLAGDPWGPGRVAWGTDPFGYGLTDAAGKHVVNVMLQAGDHKGPVRYVGVSPRDRLLAVEYDDGFRFWDIATGNQAVGMNASDGADTSAHIQAVAWGPTGDPVYWVSRFDRQTRSTISLRRVTPGAASPRRNHLRESERDVRAIAISRDGEVLILGSTDGYVNGYTVRDPNGDAPLAGSFGFQASGPVGRLAFLAGRTVVVLVAGVPAAGGRSGTSRIELWDATNVEGATKTRGVTATADPDVLAASPDDRWVVWAEGASVCVCDLPRGTVERITGHVGKVTAAAFDPTGRTLFSGGADRTVRRWELG